MSTRIVLLKSEFTLKREFFADALEALCSLAGQETVCSKDVAHFMWISAKDFSQAKTLEEMFGTLRWPVHIDEIGIEEIDFSGEKLGDEDIFFSAIAPYVEEASYIMVANEEGEIWKWVFTGQVCKRQKARIIFDL